jgi:hypothetical protein
MRALFSFVARFIAAILARVGLNPQPLPPGGDVSLNPQPLPPRTR